MVYWGLNVTFQWMNIAELYVKSHRLKLCPIVESVDGFQYNQFFQSKKELRNYDEKSFSCPPQNQAKTQPIFQTVIFQYKLTLLQIKLNNYIQKTKFSSDKLLIFIQSSLSQKYKEDSYNIVHRKRMVQKLHYETTINKIIKARDQKGCKATWRKY